VAEIAAEYALADVARAHEEMEREGRRAVFCLCPRA
ncbi:hypothetical protein RCCGEPOP_31324, partial [Rhizobium sp. Pop5]